MRIERRITFIIGTEGFAAWKLNRLKTLSSYFRSVVILKNISNGGSANAEHTLQVISIGSQCNQLCQLWIEGSDAELACMVLTDFIADQFEIVNTSHKKTEEFSYSVIEKHPTFSLPFSITYGYKEIPSSTSMEKYALISKLCSMLNARHAQPLFDAMVQREAISSTCIGNGIALPHIIVEGVSQPSMAIIKLTTPVDWYSKRGNINTVIGIAIPTPAEMPIIKACTQLTRQLLNKEFCHLITSTTEPEALKAILLHIMAKNG
ncbi:PTS sugar transporter subunit IIA [Vibrio algarum]|uniref:PTS sugar transporter subunit IIA n=1 Tax=Vibrio algarum TaxID=3020714 RepID=A0ABT4YTN1_9VIBR|nr:PTS sugar transporter subunit IIA [Vibrio sp. KJ40-1]MDB1124924.1 PTS sugar transporter subunit IIA [Vibrio sp. KJ40-1]